MMDDDLITSPALRLPPNPFFHCRETKSNKSILFICNLPSGTNLEFECRSPSCGALHESEPSAHREEENEEECYVDPNFFDTGYNLAGATGFTIWTGTRLLIEALCWKHENNSDRLQEIQSRILTARVIELGAGVGVVGTFLAACGSNVLLTDLSTLVENAIEKNLQRNKIDHSNANMGRDEGAPSWIGPNSFRIGKGWANATALDWTYSIDEQLSSDQCKCIDLIIASDVVFLVSMLQSLLNTVSSLFTASSHNNPSFILSFQRRDSEDGDESASFTTVNRVIREVKERGWEISCLAWRPVTVLKEKDGSILKDESQVFVFEIHP
jgi:predicted TPR repeat methyltransferase